MQHCCPIALQVDCGWICLDQKCIHSQGQDDILDIVVHDDSHAAQIEPIGLGHHSLYKATRDVVRTEEGRDHDEELEWKEDDTLVTHAETLAT